MIGMLRGKVWEIYPDRLILDVNSVGYELVVSIDLLSKHRPGQELILHTYQLQREDEVTLFGFTTLQEKQLFLEMLGVSGIGPKAAMSILSALSLTQVQSAIASENVNILTKVPGIGKKTAQRLILELKEKFKHLSSEVVKLSAGTQSFQSEAMETLLALGFSSDEAKSALSKVSSQVDESNTEEQVRLALRYLASR
ncbi:MAG: Holliday junction branch migration protein RuvA [Desulfitobacterium hafniense]|nr:Holliday junction branch migration protein RuvA [Desulfitobacterium hafniense]